MWFRKGYSTLNYLLVIFKESVEKGNEFGADQTSSFANNIDHKLLFAKLFWYGVSPSPLGLIFFQIFQTKLLNIKTSYSDKKISNMGFNKAQFNTVI